MVINVTSGEYFDSDFSHHTRSMIPFRCLVVCLNSSTLVSRYYLLMPTNSLGGFIERRLKTLNTGYWLAHFDISQHLENHRDFRPKISIYFLMI